MKKVFISFFLIVGLLVTFNILNASGVIGAPSEEPPKDWIVKQDAWFGHTDPNVRGGLLTSSDNYYLGHGKVLRQKFIQPGHVYETTEVIQLDKPTTTKFESALANVRNNLGNLPSQVTSLPKEHVSYLAVNLQFRGKGEAFASLQVVTNIRKEFGDDEPQKTGVDDLDFIIKTLNTPEE
jgi:hypothetical protein